MAATSPRRTRRQPATVPIASLPPTARPPRHGATLGRLGAPRTRRSRQGPSLAQCQSSGAMDKSARSLVVISGATIVAGAQDHAVGALRPRRSSGPAGSWFSRCGISHHVSTPEWSFRRCPLDDNADKNGVCASQPVCEQCGRLARHDEPDVAHGTPMVDRARSLGVGGRQPAQSGASVSRPPGGVVRAHRGHAIPQTHNDRRSGVSAARPMS